MVALKFIKKVLTVHDCWRGIYNFGANLDDINQVL
jgi:hypothetical protein